MPIRIKLAGIVALLLLPVLLLAYLFAQQGFKDIDFAAKERDGVAYLRGAWPVLMGLVVDSNAGASPAARLKGTDVSKLGVQYGAAMEAIEAARELDKALSVVGWPTRPLKSGADAERAIAAVRGLISKISDGSNLTLDPDLDSFYVMDVVTTKLPETLERLGKIVALAREFRGMASLTDDQKAEIMIQIGLFDNASTGTGGSIESAMKANQEGVTKRAVEASFNAFTSAFIAFGPEAKQVAFTLRDDAARGKLDLAKFEKLYADTAARLDAFWQVSATDLDRLLGARIDGLWWRMVMMLSIAGFVVAVALLAAWWAARSILVSIGRLDTRIRDIGDGDINAEIPGANGRDEIARIARAVMHFRDRTIEKLKQLDDAARSQREAQSRVEAELQRKHTDNQEAELRDQKERSAVVNRHVDDFAAAVGATVQAISNASSTLQTASAALTRTADSAERTSAGLASSSEDASTNVHSVAAATEEMTASISEISRQVQHSSGIAAAAVKQAEHTDGRITELSKAASRIGDVVKLITAIAEQTNLLALNATIEAARAGDAGKGFAVVAQEVKALASQTAKATEEIANQISSMQAATQESVLAIKEIGGTIAQISQISSAIAAAVEEQTATTQEIGRNVQQAAGGTAGVVAKVEDVARGATETRGASQQVLTSAQSLSQESSRLSSEIEKFLMLIRTGALNRRHHDDPNYRGLERRKERVAAA